MNPAGRQIILGVTGSIAAYKAAELLRLLTGAGHDVRVIQTPASREFVGQTTFATLSGHPVACEQFGPGALEPPLAHIEYSRADLLLIAPATASTIGKMAAGIADNLLLTTALAADCPVLIAPAMNQRMWNNAAVQANLALLVERGVRIVTPASGGLACGEEGIGRLAAPKTILARVQEMFGLAAPADLEGFKVLVTAGGTREPIDAVRYISNRSSGKMGYALAAAARSRGAEVTVIAANCDLPRLPDIRYIDVTTAGELEQALKAEFAEVDILLMAAAVSDYSVSGKQTTGKIERADEKFLQLLPIGDIVSSLEAGDGALKVGFAAEYGASNLERARQKLKDKGLDMIVFNDVSRADIGFESDYNEITIVEAGRGDELVDRATKTECAHRVLDRVAAKVAEEK